MFKGRERASVQERFDAICAWWRLPAWSAAADQAGEHVELRPAESFLVHCIPGTAPGIKTALDIPDILTTAIHEELRHTGA